MSRYSKPWVTRGNAFKPFITCSICRSDRRMFVQCVPCCIKFNAAWGVGEFRAAEHYEYEDVPQMGDAQHESSRILSEMEAAKTVLVPGISLSSPERWWSL